MAEKHEGIPILISMNRQGIQIRTINKVIIQTLMRNSYAIL